MLNASSLDFFVSLFLTNSINQQVIVLCVRNIVIRFEFGPGDGPSGKGSREIRMNEHGSRLILRQTSTPWFIIRLAGFLFSAGQKVVVV